MLRHPVIKGMPWRSEGENAVIIQPGGKIPEYIHIENFRTGPTVDSKNIWIPRITEIKETSTLIKSAISDIFSAASLTSVFSKEITLLSVRSLSSS